MVIRDKVVSAKLTAEEYNFAQAKARELYESGGIEKPIISDVLRFALRNQQLLKPKQSDHNLHLPNRNNTTKPAARHQYPWGEEPKSESPLIGYTVDPENPKEVFLPPYHTIVCGITREAGKTTALEGILSRWKGKKILVFICKPGEDVFQDTDRYTRHKPFLKQTVNWRYIESAIETEFHEKNRSIRPALMTLCEDTKTLNEVWQKVSDYLQNNNSNSSSITSYERRVYLQVYNYLKEVIPKINNGQNNFVQKLNLREDTVTVMDVQSYSPEVQAMVIGSVADEVISGGWRDIVLVIPEAWQCLPRNRGSPAKLPVERLLRMGAARGNLVMIDSQDLIHTPILKSVGNLLLGKQQEINEVDRMIENLPFDMMKKIDRTEIQRLKLGQFLFVSRGEVKKIFARPRWMGIGDAAECAVNPSHAYDV